MKAYKLNSNKEGMIQHKYFTKKVNEWQIYAYIYEHVYVYTKAHNYIHICTHTCIYVHVYTHTYAYLYTYITSREWKFKPQ